MDQLLFQDLLLDIQKAPFYLVRRGPDARGLAREVKAPVELYDLERDPGDYVGG